MVGGFWTAQPLGCAAALTMGQGPAPQLVAAASSRHQCTAGVPGRGTGPRQGLAPDRRPAGCSARVIRIPSRQGATVALRVEPLARQWHAAAALHAGTHSVRGWAAIGGGARHSAAAAAISSALSARALMALVAALLGRGGPPIEGGELGRGWAAGA